MQDTRLEKCTMFRMYTIAVGVLMGAAVACSTAAETATDADLPVTLVTVDEVGPATPAELFEESEAIAIATLTSIDEHAGFAPRAPEEEGGPFTELLHLNFKIEETLKGSIPDDLTLKWWGFIVANVDGEPGERTSAIELHGIRFVNADIGQEFMLFLRDYSEYFDGY